MATNEASIELKMLAFATAVKMDGACPNQRPGVMVIGWRRAED
jgi:hypothetical protein